MATKVSVSELGYLSINTQNVAAWGQFISEVTGMQIVDKADDGALYVRMDERHHRIEIRPSEHEDIGCIGWQARDEAALDALAAQIEAAGIQVTPGTQEEIESRHVFGLIKFKDPSGLPTEIFYGAKSASRPFYPTRQISGFKTGDLGLGHAVLWYPNVAEGVRFYRDVLGFRITDTKPGLRGAAFLHCNIRHHSLALFEPRGDMPQRMNHFMVQYQEIDDVGMAYDICERRGDRFATTLGRHPSDQSLSFYVFNPSGWHTECGWGSRDVPPLSDEKWDTEYWGNTPEYWPHERHAELEMSLIQSQAISNDKGGRR